MEAGPNLVDPMWVGIVTLTILGAWVYELPNTARKAGVPWKMKALVGLPASFSGVNPIAQWFVFGVILGYEGFAVDAGLYGQWHVPFDVPGYQEWGWAVVAFYLVGLYMKQKRDVDRAETERTAGSATM